MNIQVIKNRYTLKSKAVLTLSADTLTPWTLRVQAGTFRRFVFMRHTREEVIKRTIREFKLLDDLVSSLTDEDWNRLLTRPETKDPWTVKDALAHITHFK